MYPYLKTLVLICGLITGACLPKVFAQEDSTEDSYEAYEEEDYATEAELEAAETTPVHFSEISSPLPFNERNVNSPQWQQMTSDPAFNYQDEIVPEEKQADTGGWFIKMLTSIFDFFSSTAGKAIIWIVVALLVLLLVFRVFKLNGNILFSRKDKKLGNAGPDESADDFVPDNWEQSITEAAQAGNYRLAVRHSYRYLLSLLADKELIRFQTAKTNYQYSYELSGTRWHQPFVRLTREYEYAWYGGFAIGQEQFESYYRLLKETKQGL